MLDHFLPFQHCGQSKEVFVLVSTRFAGLHMAGM